MLKRMASSSYIWSDDDCTKERFWDELNNTLMLPINFPLGTAWSWVAGGRVGDTLPLKRRGLFSSLLYRCTHRTVHHHTAVLAMALSTCKEGDRHCFLYLHGRRPPLLPALHEHMHSRQVSDHRYEYMI